MLIEQIIEFALRRPGPPGRAFIPTTRYFHDKTKIARENLRVNYYLLQKYCCRQYTSLLPACAKSLTKFYLEMQNFKRVNC